MACGSNQHARRLFDGIAREYDLVPDLLSFFQYRLWRRYLVSRLDVGPDDKVLDLCTGTAGVARQVAARYQSRVVGVDLSTAMLKRARHNIVRHGQENRVSLAAGRAESLPFADDTFDGVCVTFLFRYVDDTESTLQEIIRVLKPGGRLVLLEFGVPHFWWARLPWYAYTRGFLPLAGGAISRGWWRVGAFLGPSISRLYQSQPESKFLDLWGKLGLPDATLKHLSLGGAVVMWGTKEG